MAKKQPQKPSRSIQPIPGIKLSSPQKAAVVIEMLPEPPTIEKPKSIHPRHLLPLVPEGAERDVHSVTRELRFDARGMEPMAAGDEIKLKINTELTQPSQNSTASNVGEPSCAIAGNTVLYTGNWYAAISSDGGSTFRFMDPGAGFPNPSPQSQFCCDQVAHYNPSLDMFVWLLQYGPSTGGNIQRLAFAKPADALAGRWKLFDITTQLLGVPNAFLDFPDLSFSDNNLYVTTNIFGQNNTFGSAVIRISFASIRSGNVSAVPFVSMQLQSFRVAQNCGASAFFAAHANTSVLAVFRWPENQALPTRTDVPVARWIGGNGYISRTPDGRRWLDRADPRITGSTLAGSELFFAWSVDRDSNHRPRPFVQIARIAVDTLTVIENINVFDPMSATCYAALATNSNNEVGISYMIGGGPRHPSHVVGFLNGVRKDLIVGIGERSPLSGDGKGEWGDYLTVRRVFPQQKLFAATGFTMKGAGNGSNRDVTPRFVVFGRDRDSGVDATPAPSIPAPSIPAPTTVPPPTIPVDNLTTPFHDVNTLPTVSPQTAATIKAACIAEGLKDAPASMDMVAPLRMVTKPGVERWPVKTGTDRDTALVGKNILDGQKLGSGIVDTTIEDMNKILRPPDMRPETSLFPKYQDRRRGPVEFVVWRVECTVIAVKLEADGDYHLVLQGASGKMMVAETPTPKAPFVDSTCPWIENIRNARKAIDDKLITPLSPQDFVQSDTILVPRAAVGDAPLLQPLAMEMLPQSFVTPESDDAMQPTFASQVPPTRARITGVGFFDKVHGQTGVSPLNGIELHPVLKIEWI